VADDVQDGINIIAPPMKRINFLGEIVEIAFVPARIDIEFNRVIEECKAGKLGDYEGLTQLSNLILKLCKSNPNITYDWLLDNASFDMMTDFFKAAKGAKNEKEPEKSSGKN